MDNQLNNLRLSTSVVADTGDLDILKKYKTTDATTNPTILINIFYKKKYLKFLNKISQKFRRLSPSEITDHLLVEFGIKILNIIPGRVSTELDARLSFDTRSIIERARKIILLYEDKEISRERVLIKIASTWEGIQAANILQQEGIQCNLTLLFSFIQALACAYYKVKMISPFVGRISDWYKSCKKKWRSTILDPGVQFVKTIYRYYKSNDICTEIMGASFRNVEQILSLSGCDLLTISPEFLSILENRKGNFPVCLGKLSNLIIYDHYIPSQKGIDEINFRSILNENSMASEKLYEGIRKFVLDTRKLEDLIIQYT